MFSLTSLGLILFLVTAVFGRVWCGWACPETVFLEFLFRPIERLIEGNASQRKKLDSAPWGPNKIIRKGRKAFDFCNLSVCYCQYCACLFYRYAKTFRDNVPFA